MADKAVALTTVGTAITTIPVLEGTRRARRDRHPQALRADGHVHLRPGLHLDGAAARARSPISTASRASCSTAAIRSTSSPSNRRFMEVSYLLLHGELPTQDELDTVQLHDHPPHDAARAARDLLSRLPARRPSDGDHVRRRRRACRPSITTAPTSPIPQQRMIAIAPADRQDADDRGDGLQIFASASRSSIRDNEPELHRQFPAHDLRRPGRALRGQSDHRDGDATGSSSSTPTTSRMRRPRPCASPARRAPTRSPASPPASPACGGRRMAAPTRRRSTCCARSARPSASRNISPAPRTRTIRSG